MRKKFGAIIFILFIAWGVFSPFLGTEKILADDVDLVDTFPRDHESPHETYLVKQKHLNLLTPGENDKNAHGAVIRLNIELTGEDSDASEVNPIDSNGSGYLDAGDGENDFGGWDSILDGDVYNSTQNGIFLRVGTKKGLSTTGEGYWVGEVKEIDLYDSNSSGSAPFQKKALDNNSFPNTFNVGYYIFSTKAIYTNSEGDPISPGNAKIDNIEIPISNLLSSTEYFAQIVLVEDDIDEVKTIGWSNVVSFTTLDESALGSNNPLTYNPNGAIGSQTGQQQATLFGELFRCKWNDWEVGHCFAELFYSIFYTFSHWLLGLAGGIFDFFVGFSLSNKIYDYNHVTFIGDGWRVVRDLSNIFFIFILMYAAIGLILKLHQFDAKSIIAKVIMIGLLVNFSLFFTRIIIDASNVLARVFYNEINIQTAPTNVTNSDPGIKIQGLSAGIVEGMDIGSMVNEETYNALKKEPGGINAGVLFLITGLGIIVNVITALTFLNISMYFIGRILGLWFAMIFAPLAFVTNIVPALGSKLPKVGWKEWVKNLTDLAIMAPIFVFFMFLIISFLQSSFLSTMLQDSTGASFTEVLISILLQFMLIIGLIKAAKSMTQKLSGEFGESVAGIAGGVAKFAGGAALGLGAGALALGGRSILGGAFGKMDNAKVRENAVKTGWSWSGWKARRQLDVAEYGKKGSFDIRQSGAVSTLSQKAGLNLNAGTGIPGLGIFNTANTAGGLEGARTREQIKLEKKAEKYGKKDKDAEDNIEYQIETRKKEIEKAENNHELAGIALIKAEAGGNPKLISGAKTALASTREALRRQKNGTGDLALLGATRVDGKTVTTQDVARGAKSTAGMSLRDLENLLETNKKARAREFLANRQKKYGNGNIKGEERDSIGNITKFGKLDKTAAGLSGSYMAKNFLRELYRGTAGGAGMGALVAGAFTGGIGAPLGAVIGAAVTGSLRGSLANYFSKTNSALSATEEAIHSSMTSGKDSHSSTTPKDYYKGPSEDFFTKILGSFNQTSKEDTHTNTDHNDRGGHGDH